MERYLDGPTGLEDEAAKAHDTAEQAQDAAVAGLSHEAVELVLAAECL